MIRFILGHALKLATLMLSIFSSQAKQDRLYVEFAEALQAGIAMGQAALDGQYITRQHVAAVRKEFNEALDALEPLLPPG